MKEIGFKTGRRILKIGNRLNYMRTIDLEQKKLTPAQSDTMIYFASNEGMSAADLAKHLEITHQAARNIVERLKSKNYLYTAASKNDGRVNSVYLTEDGKKIYALLKETGGKVGDVLLQGFSEAEKEQLFSFLERISENIK